MVARALRRALASGEKERAFSAAWARLLLAWRQARLWQRSQRVPRRRAGRSQSAQARGRTVGGIDGAIFAWMRTLLWDGVTKEGNLFLSENAGGQVCDKGHYHTLHGQGGMAFVTLDQDAQIALPDAPLPALFAPDPRAAERFLGFFTVHIRNPNTRRAYARIGGG